MPGHETKPADAPARGIAADTAALTATNAGGKLLWALSLAIAMRMLGPEAYGQLVVVWSVAGLVAPLTDLGLSQLMLRAGSRDTRRLRPLLRQAVATRCILATLATAGFAFAAARGAFGSLPWPVVALAAAAPLLDAVFLTATAVAQAQGRIVALSAWRLLGFVTLPVLLLVAWRLDAGVATIAAAWLLGSSVALAGFFAGARRTGDAADVPARFGAAVRESVPFLLSGTAALAYGKLEVAALGHADTPQAAGYYHASYQVVLLVFSLGDVLFAALFAQLYRAHADPRVLLERWPPIAAILTLLAALAAPPLAVHAERVMAVVGGAAFAEAGAVLQSLLPMVALMPLAAALQFLVLLDRPGLRAALDGACVLATLCGALLLGAHGGAVAVGWWASGAYALACLGAWLAARRLGLALRFGRVAWRHLAIGATATPLLWLPVAWWLSSIVYAALVLAMASPWSGPWRHAFFANRSTSP